MRAPRFMAAVTAGPTVLSRTVGGADHGVGGSDDDHHDRDGEGHGAGGRGDGGSDRQRQASGKCVP